MTRRPLCAAALLLIADCANAAPVPPQFDLLCEGKEGRADDAKPFSRRMHVDLDRQIFCLDGCWHLSEASDTHLVYHYDPMVGDRDHEAGTYRHVSNSSAGPFEQKEDLTVDLRTGAFKRLYIYDFGDIVSRRYTSQYSGRCRIVPVAKPP